MNQDLLLKTLHGRDPQPKVSANDYIDRRAASTFASTEKYLEYRQQLLDESTTVYVGNLGFLTSEEMIERHFDPCGKIRRIHMGLHAVTKKPCGFCFVEFCERESALVAVNALIGSILDDRVINVSLDINGVKEQARFWGRSITGCQVRDAVRHDVDLGRGGVGLRDAAAKGLHTTTPGTGGGGGSSGGSVVRYEWEQSPAWVVAAIETKEAGIVRQRQ